MVAPMFTAPDAQVLHGVSIPKGKTAMLSSISVLVISGVREHRDMLAAGISSIGPRPICCGTCESAAELLGQHPFSIVFCDYLLPDGTFWTVMNHAARCGTPIPVIVTSRRNDWDLFLKALNAGAFDYIALPPMPGEVERILCAALRECGASPKAVAQTPRGSITRTVA